MTFAAPMDYGFRAGLGWDIETKDWEIQPYQD